MKWIEILRKNDCALLQSESDTQYAVVSGYNPTQPELISLISIITLRRCYIFNQLMIVSWKR